MTYPNENQTILLIISILFKRITNYSTNNLLKKSNQQKSTNNKYFQKIQIKYLFVLNIKA